jgi:hypothetical protein
MCVRTVVTDTVSSPAISAADKLVGVCGRGRVAERVPGDRREHVRVR